MKVNTIQTFEETIETQYNNITGIVVQKDGETRYERYFHGYTADNAAHVFSVTKSVFSALIGIAIEQGNIKSVDEKILTFFPDYRILPGEETIQNVTIKHLLTNPKLILRRMFGIDLTKSVQLSERDRVFSHRPGQG